MFCHVFTYLKYAFECRPQTLQLPLCNQTVGVAQIMLVYFTDGGKNISIDLPGDDVKMICFTPLRDHFHSLESVNVGLCAHTYIKPPHSAFTHTTCHVCAIRSWYARRSTACLDYNNERCQSKHDAKKRSDHSNYLRTSAVSVDDSGIKCRGRNHCRRWVDEQRVITHTSVQKA